MVFCEHDNVWLPQKIIMKVLVLTELGSASRYWETSLPLLREKGIDAHLATVRSRGELHKNLDGLNVPNFSLDSKKSADYLKTAKNLAQISRRENYDVIHACESIPAVICGMSAIWGNKAKRIFNRQHNIAEGKQRVLSFLGSRLSHLIMPVSRSSGEAAQIFDKVKPGKIKVAYSGIRPLRSVKDSEIAELRKKLGIPENAKIISMVAHLREEKGHLELLEAGEIIASQISNPLHLVLAGSGKDEERIRQFAAAKSKFTTHFAGFQSDVALWFAIGDAVAMPSHHEAFGLSAVEAMSCGKPLVASAVGGLTEIIESGKSGVLVPPQDAEAFAEAILKILQSPELARQLGENARQLVAEKFTMEKMVDGWIDCYNFVLENSRK